MAGGLLPSWHLLRRAAQLAAQLSYVEQALLLLPPPPQLQLLLARPDEASMLALALALAGGHHRLWAASQCWQRWRMVQQPPAELQQAQQQVQVQQQQPAAGAARRWCQHGHSWQLGALRGRPVAPPLPASSARAGWDAPASRPQLPRAPQHVC